MLQRTHRTPLLLFAFTAPFRGLGQVFAPGLRALAIGPLIINIVVVASLAAVAVLGFDALLAAWLPGELDWLAWLLWPLFGVALLLAFGISAVALAAIIASPFSGPLAYRTARHLDHEPDQPPRSFAAEIAHATITALRKTGYYLLLLLPVLVVAITPGLNLLGALAWFIFGSWVLAVEFMEAPLANDGQDFREVRRTLRAHRWPMLAFGAGTTLLAMIPVVNLLLVPAAVIGATHVRVRLPKRKDFG